MARRIIDNDLDSLVKKQEELKQFIQELDMSKRLNLTGIRNHIKEELRELDIRIRDIKDRSKFPLTQQEPMDEKNIIMKILSDSEEKESTLFAANLFRMYSCFAETKNWKIKILNSNILEHGGFSEIEFSINGININKYLCYESGIHCIQWIPDGEASGNIRTSAVTVTVIPAVAKTNNYMSEKDMRFFMLDTIAKRRHGGIRTYNFSENCVTDHRINLTLYKLDLIMQGDAEDLFCALAEYDE